MGGPVADNFDWSIVLDLAVKGGAKTVQDVDQVEEAVRRLGDRDELTEKQQDNLNKTVAKTAKEMGNSAGETERHTQSLNSQRYALYEVAAAYGAVALGIGALGAKAVTAFADMESGFTKVERTSGLYGESFAPLEGDLLSLSRAIPTVTSEIQDLAARGAQMGLLTSEIEGFTEVMAKFVATSPEVDVNTVAESFGRLANLTGTRDFEALASSIAQVGVNSAATDAEIIKTTQEMARATASTSLTADEMIGLSAAFASLAVKPEAARGIMNQFFTQLDKGAAGLNDSMAVAAQVLGVTTEEATRLFKTDTGQFFQQFVAGTANVEDMTLLLNAMGTEGARLSPTFKILAKDAAENAAGQSVLAKAMADANIGFREKTELDRQYAPIADDLNSKFIIMSNSLQELAYIAGGELAPAFKGLIDFITETIQAVTDFVQTDVGGYVIRVVSALTLLVGLYATLRSAIALTSAMMIAFRTAGASIGRGIGGALLTLIGLFRTTGTAATTASTGVNKLAFALKAVGRATVVFGILQYAAEWIFNAGETAQNTGGVFIWLSKVIYKAYSWMAEFANNPLIRIWGLGVAKTVNDAGKSLQSWGKDLAAADKGVGDLNTTVGSSVPVFDEGGGSAEDFGDSLGGVGDAAAEAEVEVRSLLDYASDLSSIMSRAFDIRFGAQMEGDNITKVFLDLKKQAEDAAQKIRDLRGEIRSTRADIGVLQSDIKTQKMFLAVAIEYGDDKRAAVIRADLIKMEADLANKKDELKKKENELTKAQDSNSKTLTGNSEAAIRNRATILDLVGSYQKKIEKLAAAGLSEAELAKQTEKLRQDFIRQATQLGFNRTELKKYEKGFDDARVAIAKVPRNITIKANADPAIQAMNEFKARTDAANKSLGALKSSAASGMPSAGLGNLAAGAPQASVRLEALAQAVRLTALAADAIARRDIKGVATYVPQLAYWRARAVNGYATGGYTGPGGKYEPAGIVHKGEYVVKKEHVNQRTGLPYADAMGKLVKGSGSSRGYANGGYVGGSGVGVVDLSAQSIQHLAHAVQTQLLLDGKVVADAAGRSFARDNRVGAS